MRTVGATEKINSKAKLFELVVNENSTVCFVVSAKCSPVAYVFNFTVYLHLQVTRYDVLKLWAYLIWNFGHRLTIEVWGLSLQTKILKSIFFIHSCTWRIYEATQSSTMSPAGSTQKNFHCTGSDYQAYETKILIQSVMLSATFPWSTFPMQTRPTYCGFSSRGRSSPSK